MEDELEVSSTAFGQTADIGTRESTSEDYWNTVNPFAIQHNNPQTRFNASTDSKGVVDIESPILKPVYDSADMNTKNAILNARNESDALKIAERIQIFNDSAAATEQDGIATQIGMGIIPSIVNPTSLIPGGAFIKGAQLAKGARMLSFGAGGAISGATANIIDEALFDAQGMPTNYLGAAAIGASFGGALGILGGSLSGAYKNTTANAVLPENDSFTKDFMADPIVQTKVDENGNVQLQDIGQMEKSLVDRVPFIGSWLKSDVHTVYQSDNSVLRGYMGRISPATVSQRDSAGNLVPVNFTGQDFKRKLKGVHNNLTKESVEAFQDAKVEGYEGNLDRFSEDVYDTYISSVNKQRKEAEAYANQVTKDIELEPTTTTTGNLDFFNKIPGASEEGVGPVRKRNYIAADTYTKEVTTGEVTQKTGIDELDSLFDDMDFGQPLTKTETVTRTPGEKAAHQAGLDKEWEAFKADIAENGMSNEIIIGYKDGKLQIEEGNHRLTAANELGLTDIPVRYMDNVPEDLKFKPTTTTVEPDISGFRKAYEKAQDDWYNSNPIEFDNTPLGKGATAHQKYFQTMLKNGQDMDMKGIKGINSNKLYAPRVYNYKALHDGSITPDAAKLQLQEALLGDNRNGFKTLEEAKEASEILHKNLMETAFDMNNLTNSFMVKDLPFETNLKQRKLYLDETKMRGLLNNNFEDLTGMYHYKMSGRQSTQYAFGTDDLAEVMKDIRADMLAKGTVEAVDEVQAFERNVKDLLGDLRLNGLSDTPGWSFTRNLMTYNSSRMGGGFGGNQFIELASALSMGGFKAIMSGRLGKSLSNSGKLLYTKNSRDIDDFNSYLISSGFMGDALHTSRINRYADTEAGFNTGKLENKLNWMNDKLMKYNGMRYFMGVMEDYTGGAIVTKLKTGDVTDVQLSRWGLSTKDASNLGAKLKEVTKDGEWDLSKLSEVEQNQLQMAIGRGIEEIVVQGDSMHLPNWMKAPDPIKKVLFQFMRFPLIAQETLTRKGFKEEQATMMAAMISSTVTYMGMKYLREQASIAAGLTHPIEAKYDYMNDDESLERAVLESLNYNAPLGFMSSIYNYGAIATGNNELGRDWQSKEGMSNLMGPSFGLGEDLIQLIRSGVDGNLDDERSLQRFKQLTPFMNLPLVNEAGKFMVEEYGR